MCSDIEIYFIFIYFKANNSCKEDAERVKVLETSILEEKQARARAEAMCQDKVSRFHHVNVKMEELLIVLRGTNNFDLPQDRELSMLGVDYRQLQFRLDKTEADFRQETEKSRGLYSQLERVKEERSHMQSDLTVQVCDFALLIFLVI